MQNFLSNILALGVFLYFGYANSANPAKSTDQRYPWGSIHDTVNAELQDIPTRQTHYKFHREFVGTDDTGKAVRTYSKPDGDVIAIEEVTYENGKLKSMKLDHKQLNASGSMIVENGKLKFEYTANGKTKTDEEAFDPTTTVADQIYPTIHKNWDKLMAGETIEIRLPVLDRRETVGFKILKEKSDTFQGRPVEIIKMKPTSFIIAAVVDPLLFYIEPTGDRRTLEVKGRTLPKIQKEGKWKDFDAIMKFVY
jgi:hypothetical protein